MTVFVIKSVHSALFLLFTASVLVLLASGISGRIGTLTLVAAVLIVVEGGVLVLNRLQCPLTGLAERHGAVDGRVTNLFFPSWLVPHVFEAYAALVLLSLVLIGVRLLA